MTAPMTECSGWITGVQRFSLNDGPGIRTTIFFKGCNLACSWCHNPETIRSGNDLLWYPARCINCGHCVPVCPSGARTGTAGTVAFDRSKCVNCGKCAALCFPGAAVMAARQVTVAEVMAEIVQDRAYYLDSGGGVTLSGGEVFCQREFAGALAEACRKENIPVAVETNMLFDFDAVKPVLQAMSLIMFDLKLADPETHRRFTGADNKLILENIRLLDELGIPLIARTPLVPGATDSGENISAIAAQLAELKNLTAYELLNFNPLGASKYAALGAADAFAAAQLLDAEALAELSQAACAAGAAVTVR